MDEEIERLVVSVRADTRAFAADVSAMRAELDGPFSAGLERAGSALERGLTGAIQRGKFGFEDLRQRHHGASRNLCGRDPNRP